MTAGLTSWFFRPSVRWLNTGWFARAVGPLNAETRKNFPAKEQLCERAEGLLLPRDSRRFGHPIPALQARTVVAIHAAMKFVADGSTRNFRSVRSPTKER